MRKLIKKYGVKYNSYAGQVLKRIYQYYFGNSINLRQDYRKYYRKEYESFNDYLECHLGFPKEVINRMEGEKFLCVNLDGKGERAGESFSYEDELKKQFWEMVGGADSENQSRLRDEQFFY